MSGASRTFPRHSRTFPAFRALSGLSRIPPRRLLPSVLLAASSRLCQSRRRVFFTPAPSLPCSVQSWSPAGWPVTPLFDCRSCPSCENKRREIQQAGLSWLKHYTGRRGKKFEKQSEVETQHSERVPGRGSSQCFRWGGGAWVGAVATAWKACQPEDAAAGRMDPAQKPGPATSHCLPGDQIPTQGQNGC